MTTPQMKFSMRQQDKFDSQPSALIGSSLERKAFYDDLQWQISESAAIDSQRRGE